MDTDKIPFWIKRTGIRVTVFPYSKALPEMSNQQLLLSLFSHLHFLQECDLVVFILAAPTSRILSNANQLVSQPPAILWNDTKDFSTRSVTMNRQSHLTFW